MRSLWDSKNKREIMKSKMSFKNFRILLLALTFSLLSNSSAQSLSDFEAYSNSLAGVTMPWRLFKVANPVPGAKYPIVIFLHGSGERGTDNIVQITGQPAGPFCFARPNAQAVFPCYVIVPQMNSTWESASSQNLILSIIDFVKTRFSIDTTRIHLTGNSMGGMGTYYASQTHYDVYASFQPVCGMNGQLSQAAQLAKKPFWAWHGLSDGVVPIANDKQMIDTIRAAGGHPNFTAYRGVDHFSWNYAYVDSDIVFWTKSKHLGWVWPLKNDSAYLIVNVGSGKCLAQSGTDSTVELATLSGGNLRQQWVLKNAGNGYYQMQNKSSGKVLQVPAGTTKPMADNTAVSAGTGTADNQLWLCWDIGDRYKLVPKLCYSRDSIYNAIGLLGGSVVDGAKAVVTNYSGTDAMRWTMEAINPAAIAASAPHRSTLYASSKCRTMVFLGGERFLTSGNFAVYDMFGRIHSNRAGLNNMKNQGVYILKVR
jgi:predicted esterase